jgi:hypothetical protein
MSSSLSRSISSVEPFEIREQTESSQEFTLIAVCRVLGEPSDKYFRVYAVVAMPKSELPFEDECNIPAEKIEWMQRQKIWWKGKSRGFLLNYIGLSSYERYFCSERRFLIVQAKLEKDVVTELSSFKVAMYEHGQRQQGEPQITGPSRKRRRESPQYDVDEHRRLKTRGQGMQLAS